MLSLVPALKFNWMDLWMEKVKQIEIKNWFFYFYSGIINLKNIESNLLKIDKKHYKGIDIYYIGYITISKIGSCENVYSVNLFYLLVNHANGYIEEKSGNKHSILDDYVNENKALLKAYANVWDEIKSEIKTINGGGKGNDYGKDYMKIKFNSDNDLPLNKPLKFHAMTIIIRDLFLKVINFIRKFFLDDALYEL